MRPRFSKEKKSHYECCKVLPDIVTEYDENKIKKLNQCLTEKWDHDVPLAVQFCDKLIRCRSLYKQGRNDLRSITNILIQHVKPTSSCCTRQLLKICVSLL